MAKKNNWVTIAFIFSIMILVAMNDNVKGVFIPLFKKEFDTNNTQMGVMLFISSLGYMLSTYIGGILCEKIGQKKVMLIGFMFCILSLLGLYLSPTFVILLISIFFSNVGISLLGISINTIVPLLAVSFQAVLMNLIHFSYGLGATITQRSAGLLLFNGISWRTIYLMIAGLFVTVLLGFVFVRIPEPEKTEIEDKIKHSDIFKNRLIYFYMIALGLYVSAEMGTQNWFVNFMRESYQFNENTSTFYSALFFGIFTVGRLVGGFVLERFNLLKSVFISTIIAFILYTIGLIMKDQGVILISIAGLFFGITFPTIVLTISKVFKKNSSYIMGIIITAASATSMGINFLIGWFNDLIGVYAAYYIIPIALLTSGFFTYLIYKNTKDVLVK